MSNRLMFGETLRFQSQPLFARPQLGLGGKLRAAWRRYRTRQSISELDSHMLKDIGVSYSDAEYEANKPFWRA